MTKIYLSRIEEELRDIINAKGTMITADENGQFITVEPGPDGWALVADSTSETGLNWQPVGGGSGGSPTGPAGGDLAGLYPSPSLASMTSGFGETASLAVGSVVVSQVLISQSQAVDWDVIAVKGTTRWRASLFATIGDGTTPQHTQTDVVVSPASGGVFDIAFSVDISGGRLRLIATPSTTGWTVYYRGRKISV